MIEFRNFTFQYDSQAEATLKNIDLIIHPGEKILIIGPSGSGKSTLGKCLNGIIPQNEKGSFTGQLTINGKNFSESSIYDLSLEVGTVLQDTDSQFVGLTVAEDIAFSLENEMIEQKEMQEAVNFWAKKTNLLAQLDKRPQDLSGGQKQRISLARIFATDPDLFVLDEPTTGMDEESRNEFYRLLRHSAHVHGKSVLMITHDHEDIKQYADRQIRLVRKEDSQWRCFHMNS